MRKSYRILVETLEGRRLVERPKCKWEENIKRDLK
jgi:hypothetical protein